ncbi:GAF domain-containing sensor histidine kinase [Halorarum halophilum]|uniref:histidine kinase n=1 Tax=Halorarum halophilum TaxID=2743090 RepID=A0A7D5GDM0_9EURY|nr:GAF domain-containing sensor histidine kinase [Halobaculum halophilum]QLG29146.1 GAF domain-containing sensor histidine kinase [Halobaculum halophilum]
MNSLAGDDAIASPERSVPLHELVLDASTSLMSAELDEVDAKLDWTLAVFSEALGADRSYVFQRTGDGFALTHGWRADGVVAPWRKRLHPEEFAWLHDRLDRFENVAVRTADLGDDEEATRRTFRETGVESMVAVPLVADWRFEGYLAFDTVEEPRRWTEEELSRLRTVGDVVAHSFARVDRESALRRQNERLETFASVVSHDLRNPLNVVTGSLDLIATDAADGNGEHLARAERAAGRMEDIIDRMLTLARQGADIGETESIPLATVAERAWSTVRTVDATIEIERESLGTVETDAERLREAFENLFRNAVEHGGDDVSVRVSPLDAAPGFFVADDGPGIPTDCRESLFEYGVSSERAGTGFGLAIVRRIVEAHGWKVGVADAADGGARIEVAYAQAPPEA